MGYAFKPCTVVALPHSLPKGLGKTGFLLAPVNGYRKDLLLKGNVFLKKIKKPHWNFFRNIDRITLMLHKPAGESAVKPL